jgi:mono/diheme cytochrome c family protein
VSVVRPRRQVLWAGALVCALVLTVSGLRAAGFAPNLASRQVPATRSVQDGVFTDAQAARGERVYAQGCAGCHGAALQGAAGPPLTGGAFLARWQADPLAVLVSKIKNTMPADAPGTLTDPQIADLVGYLLKASGFPAGRTELAGDTTRITWPQRAPTTTARAGGSGTIRPPAGNLAQWMRGLFFPNSNLIFAVQQQDPGAPKPPANVQAGSTTYFDWGMGIYTGWQVVDNAAIALIDISPMMLNPELTCENGKPAPVTDPDWIKFTEQLITVSKDIYRKSQARNQEAVSDATGDLSEACAACHTAYRDVRGPGRGGAPGNPQANAGRCQSRNP